MEYSIQLNAVNNPEKSVRAYGTSLHGLMKGAGRYADARQSR